MGLQVGIALGVASLASTAFAYKEQKESIKYQKKSQEAQTNIQTHRNIMAARQVVRENRRKAAMIAQASQNTGVRGSTGEVGGIGGMGTRAGVNVGFQNVESSAAKAIGRFNQEGLDAEGRALLGQTVAGITNDWSKTAFGLG